MTRKAFGETLLGIFVVTLVISNVLLASQTVALREQIPFMVSRAVVVAQDREALATPTPSVSSLLADVWSASQSVTATNKIKIASLAPSVGAGPVNTKVTIKGSGFTSKNNTVIFGYHKIADLKSNGMTLTFSVPGYLIYPCTTGQPCPTHGARKVVPGHYPVYVNNSRGTSAPATFIVTEGPSPSIAP